MRNIQKIMISVFCFGVLLAGIGTGIALNEFSSFHYAGEIVIGDTDIKTESFDLSLDLEEGQKIRIMRFYGAEEETLEENEEVPEGTLRFVVTYNAATVSPHLSYDMDPESAYAGINWTYISDDNKLFLETKDEILKRIKQKEYVSVKEISVEQIKVLVNPATAVLLSFE